jgi:phage tail tape-measure protein
MARRLTPEDLALTAAEKRAAQVQAEGGAGNRAIGSTIGNIAGAGLGALGFLVPGAGAILGPAAMAAGSQLGGALGGMAGDAFSEEADDDIAEGEMKRQEKLARYKLRQDALNALMSED